MNNSEKMEQILEQAKRIIECPIDANSVKGWYGFWENTLINLYNQKNPYYFEACEKYMNINQKFKFGNKKIDGRRRLGKAAKIAGKASVEFAYYQWKVEVKDIAHKLLNNF